MNPLFVLFVTACAVWVYLDATKNKIGKTSVGGVFNMSASAWGTVSLLIWIIAFPAYLIKRNSLKSIAEEHPVNVNGRGWKATLIGVIGLVWFILVAYSQYLEQFN